MSEKWYWKHRGELRGPLETDDLAALVRQRRVFDHDQLRLEESDEWIPGRRIKEMFAVGKPAAKVHTSPGGSHCGKEASSAGSRFEMFLPSISLSGVSDFFADRIAFLLTPLFSLALLFGNRRILLGTAFIVLIAVLGMRNWNGGYRLYHSAFQELMTTWDDLERLRVTNAGESEWNALRAAALPRVEPLIKSLQKDARRLPPGPHEVGTSAWKKNFTSRKLLSACQTLREVLNHLPEYDLDKTNFVAEMNNARDLLTGAELRVITEPPQRANVAGLPANADPAEASPFFLGLAVLDVLLAVGGAVWFWRSRHQ